MPTNASALRLRVGAELRRLREAANLSGEQVASALEWSQPKVSRIELGRTAYTVRDVARLLALYGVTDDVRTELLAATAEDTGESAWIVRAGGFPRRQGSIASLEIVTKRIRQYQPVLVPGLLQTYEYAQTVAAAHGATDPAAIAAARMQRQDVLKGKDAPTFDVVLDARALLCRAGPVDVLRNQILHLATCVKQGIVNLNIDPPYAVRYGSNFQPFVRKREVKDGDDASMTREPEMVKAYRDTWELGLHSYLTNLLT